MPTYTPIFTRSPRFVQQAGTAGQETKVELYLWNSPSSEPASPTYTLTKPIPSTVVTTCSYDISPYCREYISHSSYTEVTSLTASPVGEYCYCTAKVYLDAVLQTTYSFICFDGFGYFGDSYNPSPFTSFLTEGTYQVSDTGNSGGIYYFNDGTNTWTATYTGLVSGTTAVTLTHTVGYIPYVHSSYTSQGNTLVIDDGAGGNSASYRFEVVCEPRYTVIDCDFVNRFGHWQRLVFFKASQVNMEMTNTEYYLMPDTVNYSLTENRKQVFNVNAIESIKCNTGWVDEGYSEVMKELMLSEKVLLDGVPVKLRTKSTKLYKHINDKLINYEVEFEYSHEMLNYII